MKNYILAIHLLCLCKSLISLAMSKNHFEFSLVVKEKDVYYNKYNPFQDNTIMICITVYNILYIFCK